MFYSISVAKNIISRNYDKIDCFIYYNLSLRKFYLFEGVAATVCKKLKESNNTSIDIIEICDFIRKEFNCSAEDDVKSDVLEVMRILEQEKLVKFTPQPSKINGTSMPSGTSIDNNTISEGKIERDILDVMADALIPYTVTFEITNDCPLHCIHCYCPPQFTGKWNMETFPKILKELKDLGAMDLQFTGGECFAHPDMDAFLALAHENEFVFSVLTNGILINKERARFLASCYPRSVQVSLYAADPKTHDAVTQVPGSFEKTITGIKNLQEAGINPDIACTIMQTNHHAVNDLYGWCESENLSCTFGLKLSPSHNPTKHPEKLACFQEPWIKKLLSDEKFNPIIKAIKQNKRGTSRAKVAPGSQSLCQAGFRNLCLTADGFVLPCNTLRLECGNVFEETLEHIWNNSAMLQKWRKITIDDYPKCASCNALAVCEPCPADYFTTSGSLEKIDEQTCFFGKIYYETTKGM